MGQADLNGSEAGRLVYPTAEEIEVQLLKVARELANDSARLARAKRDSAEYAKRRAEVDAQWQSLLRHVAMLRMEERRETRLLARDLLHGRLARFFLDAGTVGASIHTWETTFKSAITWLNRWSGYGPPPEP